MRLILIVLLGWLAAAPLLAADLPDEALVRKELQQAEANKSAHQAEIVDALQSTLNFIKEGKASAERSRQYQSVIDDFPRLAKTLREQEESEPEKPAPADGKLSVNELEQRSVQLGSRLLDAARQLQQEQELARGISDSLILLPQQQNNARKALRDAELSLQSRVNDLSPLGQAQRQASQAETAARRARVDELELAQLSASNRQELSRLRANVLKKRRDRLDAELQEVRNRLNSLRQQEAEQALERTELLAGRSGNLPKVIAGQLQINRELSAALNEQAQRMDLIASQQRQTAAQTLQVRQALDTLREQAQWLGDSPALGETLRAQVSRLPDLPKPQQLDSDMAQLRAGRLHYEDMLNKLPQLAQSRQDNGSPLTEEQNRILLAQLQTQRNLLNSLLSGYDNQILELTKLKVANSQLVDAMGEIREAAHRYLFWVADVSPLGLTFPVHLAQDLKRLLSLNTITQLIGALVMMTTSQDTLLPLFGALLLVGFGMSSRRHYRAFLARSADKVGNVTQDDFRLTLRAVFWSLMITLPLPILWAALGYGLRQAWPYPIAVAIGDGVIATVPVLWLFMVSADFARPHGLFIAHLGWPERQVTRAMRYYTLSTGLIVPLIMALITFDNLNEREFSGTLGRLCFILLCAALSLVTNSLKRAGIPLYLDKSGQGDNVVNRTLWNLLQCAPLAAAAGAGLGHLAAAQALLARLETSVVIWFFLLVVYHIICRWMFIQRRRIAFDRARQRRADILAQRARQEDAPATPHEPPPETDETDVDLDAISAQSLHLVRSLMTLVALVAVILLWSEIHSAFGFLENIRLWDVSSSAQGVDSIQPITLASLLIALLVFMITLQLVRNLPALLELALLQHLDLAPGTGYAITTVTKYLLMLIGGLIGFSWIGIEWSKLQWLVAALGVGLGFGLQEIFANFISGLMILFEKPIRIGDTVTIRDLTGSVTRINTRATTITDWDRKEIIMPNKAFITEQFINWSLSDSVTRIVLTVPATLDADSDEVTLVLKQAAQRCPLVLDNPQPEAFLVDLQQGIMLFELRVHAAEMGHRMPLRHQLNQLIIEGYRENDLTMPFPPFQVRVEKTSRPAGFRSGSQ
ncbi:miniconductance mechanosensitive channel MscM [Martelella alba]|uniref:Miniconductance mechanosensitive channel MscM n=1 Tax=Martelella alba TaxID=2590451 RepID=A0ABY2SSK3_9HYPH|nr:miniconductance mechanosensitive channel MscM [Martelella alba]TKI08508.1 miniconductance mechanosensitive channel MscM [Martelella alba]